MPLCHSISYERVSGDLLLSVEEKKKNLFTKDSLFAKNIKISPEEVKDWEVMENLNFLNSIYARQRFLNFRARKTYTDQIMAIERTLSIGSSKEKLRGKQRTKSSLFDHVSLSQLNLTKYSKTAEFSAKYVATLANADTLYSLTQYFKRRMDHINRQYIFLYNKKTKTLLRLHAFMPNLTKNEFIEFGDKDLIREITVALLRKSKIYDDERTRISYSFVNYPHSKSPAFYLRMCHKNLQHKGLGVHIEALKI